MKYPCEFVAKYVLPTFRSMIAKELIEKHGFTQLAVAEKLGTTQAAISYYLSSKRGEKFVKQLEEIPMVQLTSQEIIEKLKAGTTSKTEVRDKLCALCLFLRNRKIFDNIQN